jgi:hypothetical protein
MAFPEAMFRDWLAILASSDFRQVSEPRGRVTAVGLRYAGAGKA